MSFVTNTPPTDETATTTVLFVLKHNQASANMKVPLIFFACVALALSEPPPSNQYLPAASGGFGGGAGVPSSQYGTPSAGGFGKGIGGGAGFGGGFGGGSGFGGGFGGGQGGLGLGGGGLGLGGGRPSTQYGAPGLGGAGGFPGGARPSSQYGAPGAGGYSGRGGDNDGPSEPANYNFKYDVQAPEYGVDFGHEEGRQGDNARGKYYVLLPDGRKQTVTYTADQSGYHPEISYAQEGSGIGAGGQGFGGGAGGYPSGGPGGLGAGGYPGGGLGGGAGGYPRGGPGGSDGY